MIALKLVRLIETHSEELAAGLMEKLLSSERTRDLRKVPLGELKQRRYEIYHSLGDWLLTKTEADIQHRYTELGARRAAQGITYSQFCWAIAITKDHLWEFLQREGSMDRAIDILGSMDLLRLLDQFFDRALYYAALGYEGSPAGHRLPRHSKALRHDEPREVSQNRPL